MSKEQSSFTMIFEDLDKKLFQISRNRRTKLVVIDYVVYPRTMKEGPLMLTDLVRRVRFALHKRKWIYDPKEFALTQGSLTVRTVTRQPLLSKDVAPIDLQLTDKSPSLEIVYSKTCPALLINANVQVFPLICRINQESSIKQTCRFFCDNVYHFIGSECRVCLASGAWSDEQAACVNYCSALRPLNHDRILPSICLNASSSKEVPSSTKCVRHCAIDNRFVAAHQRLGTKKSIWENDRPVCEKERLMLLQPLCGIVSPTECTTENSIECDVRSFSCMDWYSLQGTTIASCDHAGR